MIKFYFRLIIILAVFNTIAMAQEARNLIYNGDFERYSTQTFVYDGVDTSGYLDVGSNSSPAMADIDGDRKKDLVVGGEEGLIYCYLNQGTDEAPQFTSASFFQPYYGDKTFGDIKVQLLAWDNNDKIDILLGTRQGWVFILKGRGDGSFGSGTSAIRRRVEVITGLEDFDIGTYAAPASIDWNGDKKKDLILGEGTYGANSIYIFFNELSDSSPSFKKEGRTYLAYGEGREHLAPAIVDWDGDGDWDLVAGEKSGFLNLYLNNPPPRRVGEEEKITILDYSKRLETTTGPIKLSYPTPWIVDWDNDGDFDLLSGSSDGRIYLFVNEGTKDSPLFSPPEILKGGDRQVSINVPSNWSQSYAWGSEWRRRNGVYVLETDETEPFSGKKCLKLSAMRDYSGSVIIHTSVTLHDDKEYILTFYAKGEDIQGSWDIIYSENVVEKEERQIKGHTATSNNFSISSSWKKVEKKFKLPTKGKGKSRGCNLRFFLSGKGSFYLDEVSLQEVK